MNAGLRALLHVRRLFALFAVFCAAVATVALVLVRANVQSDMAALLPNGDSFAERLLISALHEGAATLILIGIEGAPEEELARLSREVTERLLQSGDFQFVANGDETLAEKDLAILFRYRYLLAPADFSVNSLHNGILALLRGLSGSAAALVKRYGLADPPGAFLAILKRLAGSSKLRLQDGVWFAPEQARALIVARTRALGTDIAGQDRAVSAIEAAFAGAHPGHARLLAAGVPVFARDAAARIRADVHWISVLSSFVIVILLLLQFRSIGVLAAIAVPALLGIAAAAAVVQAVFGFVHTATLGFGITMLGITLDYPVLLLGHRKQNEPVSGTLARIGKAFALSVTCVALGLTAMMFSPFPGLSQLGLFALVGVLVAAGATRFLLPPLIVAAGLAPVSAGRPERLPAWEALRRHRLWAALPVGAAIAVLAVAGGVPLETDLAHLSPVPLADQKLDEALRAEVGAPEVGQLVLVEGDSIEAVLEKEESLMPLFRELQARGILGGREMAADYLPSVALQQARQKALPDPKTLAARLDEALAGTPFRSEAFQPFLADVAASRELAPLRPPELPSPLLAARVEPLLLQAAGSWFGIIAPIGPSKPQALAEATKAVPGLRFLDVKKTTDGLVQAYTRQAERWLLFGGFAALAALVAGLWDARRIAGVLAAVGAAIVVTLGLLTLFGTQFSVFHLVALQLVAGVGLDYAIFFARRQLDVEERLRTLRALGLCNAMTLATFGLLAFSRVPLLRGIGVTVGIGALSAIFFGFLFAAPIPEGSRRSR